LNPNSLAILRFAGFVYNQLGDHAKALAVYDQSLRFGSMDADAWGSYLGIAFAHFFARRFGESLLWIDKAFTERPDHPVVAFVKVAAMAASDQPPDEVQVFMRKWLGDRPPLPISAIRQRMSAFRQDDAELFVAALRKAGLPE
jgi:tetratricopeptide (TPR) repeat protein